MASRWALFAALLALALTSPLLARTWVDRDGKTIDATFVRVEEDRSVVLNLAGRTVKVPYDNLSDADQQYVQRQLQARGESHLLEGLATPSAAADPAAATNPSESPATEPAEDAEEEQARDSSSSATGRFPKDEVRIWTDNVGRQIEAKFIRIYLENVVLQQGRKMVQVPLENLSDFDLDYLRSMMASRGQGYLIPSAEELRERATLREAARRRDPNQAGFGGTTLAEQMANDIMGVPRNRAGEVGAGGSTTAAEASADPYTSGPPSAGRTPPYGPPSAASGGYGPPGPSRGGYGPRLPDRPTRPEPVADASPYTGSAGGSYAGAGGSPYSGGGNNDADAGYNNPYTGSGNPYTPSNNPYSNNPYSNNNPYASSEPRYNDPYNSDPATSNPFRRAGEASPPDDGAFGSGPVAMNNRYSPPGGGDSADSGDSKDKPSDGKTLRAAAGTTLRVTDADSKGLMALIALIVVVGAAGLAVCFGYFT
jgi:hypothetical protein